MFKIYNGGEYFYQWDLGQRLVMDEPFTKVHYCNRTGDCALVCETYEEDGQRLVHVPNILLQDTANIRVYGVYEEGEDICYSKCMQIFRVISRGKPDSYVYTEDEVMSWTVLEARVNEGLENTGYYVPTVDTDGNLSWAASKESLPATETVNIKGEKGDKGDTGEVSLAYANSTFANVLKGNKLGEAIGITDISPVEHTMGVKVKSKNILIYPYETTTTTASGITWTDNGDGTITANGTNTGSEDAIFKCQIAASNKLLPKVGVNYTVSGCPNGGSRETFYVLFSVGNGSQSVRDFGAGETMTIRNNAGHFLQLRVAPGATVNNLVFKPQIEEGEVATGYTPYVPDISTASVSKCGKNVVNINTCRKVVMDCDTAATVIDGNNYTIKGNASSVLSAAAGSLRVYLPEDLNTIGKTTTVSFYATLLETGANSNQVRLYYENNLNAINASTNTYSLNTGVRTKIVATFENMVTNLDGLRFYVNNNKVLIELDTLQIEYNSSATEYELYKEPVSYTPSSDGTVEGVTAIYPNTTLIASTGVVIDCEYNRDINKAFAELEDKLTQALISLGNNI